MAVLSIKVQVCVIQQTDSQYDVESLRRKVDVTEHAHKE